MNLIEIKYNNTKYVCENTLEEIESQMLIDSGFLKINECYWEFDNPRTMTSKRRIKLLIKSNVQEITALN